MAIAMTPTLTGEDYCSPEIYRLDCDRIFHRQWFYAGRAESVDHVGDRLLVDVGGESILVVRDREGELHAHYNVCRHRGSQLCDASGSGFGAAITCPYHAWSYALDGRLVATPHVGKDELDRDQFPLRSVAVEDWQGFLFVNLADDPPTVRDWIADQDPNALAYERLEMDRLRIGRRTSCDVAANWKILIENYAECLHCPQVHPELTNIIPLHQQGDVIDPTRTDGGTWLAEGADSFSLDGRAPLPVIDTMTAQDATSYQASCLYPNMFIDITGTSVLATQLIPKGPDCTQIDVDYLFDADAVAADDFDPSAVVDFTELVLVQDNAVCERTQRGVASRSFDHGYFAARDSLCGAFTERYLADRGPRGARHGPWNRSAPTVAWWPTSTATAGRPSRSTANHRRVRPSSNSTDRSRSASASTSTGWPRAPRPPHTSTPATRSTWCSTVTSVTTTASRTAPATLSYCAAEPATTPGPSKAAHSPCSSRHQRRTSPARSG